MTVGLRGTRLSLWLQTDTQPDGEIFLVFGKLQAQEKGVEDQSDVAHGYDCSHIWERDDASTSGTYRIKPQGSDISFLVYCKMSELGGWTSIQRHDGSDGLNFDETWDNYKNGFGELEGEHWLGLEYMYLLTHQPDRSAKLHISLGDFSGNESYAEYNPFSVGNGDLHYKLSAGNYSGTAGDAFLGNGAENQHGSYFGTRDHPTDNCQRKCKIGDMRFPSCGDIFHSGWWYNACGSANLNGVWHSASDYKSFASSVSWPTWKIRKLLKFSEMYLIHH
ncbi:fibrinogen-like protein 1 [Dendropsophus ebraccatus]|uniref:fibrinogen-like protein 1 n=1 Tax=Dendropsophus ebraccatus TaxID=150705 RepID=UPI00383221FD